MSCINYLIILFGCISIISCTQKQRVVDHGNWVKLGNGEKLSKYRRVNDSIFYEYIHPWYEDVRLMYIEGADSETFEVCIGSAYARDLKRVYYPNFVYNLSGTGDDFQFLVKGAFEVKADVKTFKYIGNGYGADKSHMYNDGKRIEWDNEVILTNGTHNSNWVDTIPIVESTED